jgi:hypothetical protein
MHRSTAVRNVFFFLFFSSAKEPTYSFHLMGCAVRNFFWIVQIGDSDDATVFGCKKRLTPTSKKKFLDRIPGLVLMARNGCGLLYG